MKNKMTTNRDKSRKLAFHLNLNTVKVMKFLSVLLLLCVATLSIAQSKPAFSKTAESCTNEIATIYGMNDSQKQIVLTAEKMKYANINEIASLKGKDNATYRSKLMSTFESYRAEILKCLNDTQREIYKERKQIIEQDLIKMKAKMKDEGRGWEEIWEYSLEWKLEQF